MCTVVGNQKMSKKSKKGKKAINFQYKTILFSPRFQECDSIVVLIPPQRAAITYTGLAIDEGLAYGTMSVLCWCTLIHFVFFFLYFICVFILWLHQSIITFIRLPFIEEILSWNKQSVKSSNAAGPSATSPNGHSPLGGSPHGGSPNGSSPSAVAADSDRVSRKWGVRSLTAFLCWLYMGSHYLIPQSLWWWHLLA